ncbi:MAG: hypothetical protein WB561_04975 [Terracidiphilus sp.]
MSKRDLLAIAVATACSFGICWIMGGSFETITHGNWAGVDDGHPTNYLDTNLHPDR